jgi:hypothetical protein
MKDRGFIRNDILDWAFWLYLFGRLLAWVQEISHCAPMKDGASFEMTPSIGLLAVSLWLAACKGSGDFSFHPDEGSGLHSK